MTDEETNETNEEGKESSEDTSQLDKLKAHNDLVEKELVRGREFKKEAQELEAEKMVSGRSNAGQEPEKPKEISDEDYVKKVMAGEIPDEKKEE
jgi:hypothetical protein